MTRAVWAVSSGSYSDYRVHALFETKEAAEGAQAIDRQLDVEEFVLYDAVPERHSEFFVEATRSPGDRLYSDRVEIEGGWFVREWSVVRWPWDQGVADLHVMDYYIKEPNRPIGSWWFRVEGRDQDKVRRKVADILRTLNDRIALGEQVRHKGDR